NTTRKPKELRITWSIPAWFCIYKVEGDTLSICMNENTNLPLPDEFRTMTDSERMLFVYHREKPAQGKKAQGADKRPDLSGTPFAPETKKRPDLSGAESEKPISPSRSLKGTHKFWSVSYGPDGKTLATVTFDAGSEPGAARTSAVRLWDVRTGDVVRTFAEDPLKDRGYATIAGVALSPDGKTVAAPASGQVDGGGRGRL